MALISLKANARLGKYGVVRVHDESGAVVREYKITQAELQALHASAKGGPPGCTAQEWESGRVSVYGKDFDVGDVLEENGHLKIKYAETLAANGRIVESFLKLRPSEWTGTAETATVLSATLESTGKRELLSLVGGVLDVDMTRKL